MDKATVTRPSVAVARCSAFNNYAKSILLQLALHNGSSVVELGSGSATNMLKYQALGVKRVVFVDNSREALEEGQQRLRRSRLCYTYQSMLRDFTRVWTHPPRGDTVLALFSLQYIGKSMECCLSFFENAARMLSSGGALIGILPNAQKIAANIRVPQCPQIFNCTGTLTTPEPQSGDCYTFTVPGKATFTETLLLTKDLLACASSNFMVSQYMPLKEFVERAEICEPQMCADLYRRICDQHPVDLSIAETSLTEIYDIVWLTRL